MTARDEAIKLVRAEIRKQHPEQPPTWALPPNREDLVHDAALAVLALEHHIGLFGS